MFVFDRRGRGASGDGADHSLAREVEDLEAVLDVAAPGATLVGHSFGGAVALEAARRAEPGALNAVAVYEPAVGVGGTISPAAISEMEELIELGDADAALDIAIAGLDAAGLVHADARLAGSRRPARVLALAPTVPRELRAVTSPGLRPVATRRSLCPRWFSPARTAPTSSGATASSSPPPCRMAGWRAWKDSDT